MRHEILERPDFGIAKITFEQPGEQLIAEAGAMVARDTAIEMKTNMRGGLGGALKRKLLGGESLFQNTFTATQAGQTLWLAPAPEGDLECIEVKPGQPLFIQSGAYVASTPGVTLDTKWQGAKGFFSGSGIFLLKAEGQGLVWFASYGGIHPIDIGQTYPGYICDTNHVLGFTAGLTYNVTRLGGLKSLFLSGEGLVCNFQGQGRLYIQTRSPGALAAFVHPFRTVQAKGS